MADTQWNKALGLVAGMASRAGADVAAVECMALAAWYMDGTPAGGRADVAVQQTLADRGPVANLWAVLRVLAFEAPLTKRGKPSRARLVTIKQSFQSQAREALADRERVGPLSAKQLLRAGEWYPCPDPVARAAAEVEALPEPEALPMADPADVLEVAPDGLEWADPADVVDLTAEDVARTVVACDPTFDVA